MKICGNRTFHTQTAFRAPAGAKPPKKLLVLTLHERGAPPGCHFGHLWSFSRKGLKMGEVTLEFAILPKYCVLGHFRDFRDSGLPEMAPRNANPGGPPKMNVRAFPPAESQR